MTYEKIDGIIYETRIVKTVVDLEALKQTVADLKAIEKPTDEKLIELGRAMHEYYLERESTIADLEAEIAEIEKVK